jgi:ligand-binding sensor domain-containing protein
LALIGVPRRTRSIWLGLVQFLIGAAMVSGLAALLARSAPAAPLPAGWQILRPPAEVAALALDGEVLWVGGRDGLLAVDRKTVSLAPLPAGGPDIRYVSDLLVDGDGGLWIAHQAGLTRLRNGEWRTFGPAEGVPAGPTTSAFRDRAGALWVGVAEGVVRFEREPGEGERTRYTARDGPGLATVDVIYQDSAGLLWLGSASPNSGGLASFDGQTWRAYSTRDGLAHPSINGIVQDRAGTLWVAIGFADLGGASFLRDGVWRQLTEQDGLAGAKVRSVFEDRDGRLWLGSEYDGITVLDGDRRRVFTPRDGLSGWEVKEMVQDESGVYWLGTEDGLTRIARIEW